ncbi:L-aspartate oxidase [Nakamurella deserti]|uniref:L-aspartate oxidase n=1 Tax=Nakamurella deserti TaxID=2164074 RepID=UPI000DBE4FEE|nr:L-aspartate oxidase [Nakamurella deserti]
MTAWEAAADVVVVGSGVAGLTCARDAAAYGLSVLVVTKAGVDDGSTRWAQGGVAVVDEAAGDSVGAHLADTLSAGAGLCDPVAARDILAAGPTAVARLRRRGAVFDTDPDGVLLRTREGGHHADRIVHAGGDATGAEVARALTAPQGLPVTLADHLALDVALSPDGTAVGVRVLTPDGTTGSIRAAAVVLATGGLGQLFASSTNPAVATADGVAMALRAGAVTADLEFVQFHPTALFGGVAAGRRDLVTEALRGAGAVLVDGAGRSVTAGVHPAGDLAPRDVVALAVTRRMAENVCGIDDHVFLDARAVPEVTRRFPTVAAAAGELGLRLDRHLLPVSPAAHYSCGGVWTDRSGRTSVPGLWAVGEVARTGLHGANRLASNSLLEGLVMGGRAAAAIAAEPVRAADTATVRAPATRWCPPARREEFQRSMSRYAGIGRDAVGLGAVRRLAGRITDGGPGGAGPSRASVEATNLAQVGAVLAAAATARSAGVGCHVRTDDRPDGLVGSLFVSWRDGAPVVDDRRPSGREVANR